eukprot:1078533-Amphidinium_carterae.1
MQRSFLDVCLWIKFKLAWPEIETPRPDLCGASSLLASHLRIATIQNTVDANALVGNIETCWGNSKQGQWIAR